MQQQQHQKVLSKHWLIECVTVFLHSCLVAYKVLSNCSQIFKWEL